MLKLELHSLLGLQYLQAQYLSGITKSLAVDQISVTGERALLVNALEDCMIECKTNGRTRFSYTRT